MKSFILTAHEITCTTLGRFAAMKSDWEKLSLNQQIACVNRLLLGTILSQDNKDRLARFVKTVNMPEFVLGNTKITRISNGNMLEFILSETMERMPVMQDTNDETYMRFIEDAKDELEK